MLSQKKWRAVREKGHLQLANSARSNKGSMQERSSEDRFHTEGSIEREREMLPTKEIDSKWTFLFVTSNASFGSNFFQVAAGQLQRDVQLDLLFFLMMTCQQGLRYQLCSTCVSSQRSVSDSARTERMILGALHISHAATSEYSQSSLLVKTRKSCTMHVLKVPSG